MKKNKTLKLASGLLILCLITTCVIGTTLAKYTTGGSAQDSAQVAKWGVRISMLGDGLFANEYSNTTNGVTVKSTQDVVAPGTSSDESTAAKFSISGTPEVKVNITIDFDMTNDVYLKAGTYADETTATDTADNFTLSADYHPIVFTLKQIKNATGDINVTLKSGTLAEIEAFLNDWSQDYAPNTDLTSEFELSWVWSFSGNDQADTYLGNRIAASETNANYSYSVGYTLTVTATQID